MKFIYNVYMSERLKSIGLRTGSPLDKRLYDIWRLMHYRCESPKHKNYYRYGGRGISVCEEWSSFVLFAKWSLDNGYQDNLTIDRINNDGNYEPSNCRWVTQVEQMNNTSRGIHVEIDGQIYSFNIMKRGSKWQYRIEGKTIDGKRNQISKSGFCTREECIKAGKELLKSLR